MDVKINSRLVIPSNEIQWRFSRASCAGGQNVNKTDSRVEIIFDVKNSKVLTAFQKSCIYDQLKGRIINGCICIAVQQKRTQYLNRQLAIRRLVLILRDGLKLPPKARIKTIPTRASQRRRVESKKKRGAIKKNRQSISD